MAVSYCILGSGRTFCFDSQLLGFGSGMLYLCSGTGGGFESSTDDFIFDCVLNSRKTRKLINIIIKVTVSYVLEFWDERPINS